MSNCEIQSSILRNSPHSRNSHNSKIQSRIASYKVTIMKNNHNRKKQSHTVRYKIKIIKNTVARYKCEIKKSYCEIQSGETVPI